MAIRNAVVEPLTAAGLGSGLDITALVDQLVAAERQAPNNRLNLAEARVNRQVSSIGKLKSALAGFRDKLETLTNVDEFLGRKSAVSVEDLLSVTTEPDSATGTYDIEISSLATGQKIASQPFVDSATAVGYGTLTISTASAIVEVEISDQFNTLADISEAIDAAFADTGVRASIVTADDGARLVLTGAEGSGNAFSIAASGGDGGLSVLDYSSGTPGTYTEVASATDAVVTIDSFTVTSSGNVVAGAIEGVTLNLLDADPGSPFTVSITSDESKSTLALTSFVAAYNILNDTIKSETSFNVDTGESGALLGDSLIRRLQGTVRSAVSEILGDTNAAFRTLAEIGITTTSAGRLELNDAKLSDAIATDVNAVAQLFSAQGSIGSKLLESVQTFVDSDGFIELREDRLKDRLEDISEARTRLDQRLEAVRERFQRQFNAMDTLVAQLGTTSQFLAQQLG
jgi:flagellar hook-associated protein 2